MDIMPKRRKKKDNPYVLSKDKKNNIYSVSFKDSLNVYKSIRISKEIYDVFNTFELEDISEMNEFDRHIEHLPMDLTSITVRATVKNDFEEEIISKINVELIKREIWKLPTPQNRRVYKYLIEQLSNKEIAEVEKCDHSSISKSINTGMKKLRKNLKNFQFITTKHKTSEEYIEGK